MNHSENRALSSAFPVSLITFLRASFSVAGLGVLPLGAQGHPSSQVEIEPVSRSMAGRGISPYFSYTGEYFANHSGGIDRGEAWAGLVDVGIELDLERLVGWKGASFYANAFYFAGDDISGERVGDFNAVSNLYSDTRFNFYNIYFQQAFGDADSFFKIGQIALDDDFMVSESALFFLNAGFGSVPTQSGNTAAPIYGLAAPGLMVNYEPSGNWFFRAGLYNGDSGPANSSNRGFDWETGSSSGLMAIAEGGFTYGESGASIAKIGGYYHSGEFERFSSGEAERGLYSFYGVIDHELIAADGGPGVNLFARAGIAPLNPLLSLAMRRI